MLRWHSEKGVGEDPWVVRSVTYQVDDFNFSKPLCPSLNKGIPYDKAQQIFR